MAHRLFGFFCGFPNYRFPCDVDQQVLATLLQISEELPICAMEDDSTIFVMDGHISYTGQIHWISKGTILPFSQNKLLV
jgi:hypothetical protein